MTAPDPFVTMAEARDEPDEPYSDPFVENGLILTEVPS